MKRIHTFQISNYAVKYSLIISWGFIYNPNTFEAIRRIFINPIKL